MSETPIQAAARVARERYNALTQDQKTLGWDAYHHLSDRRWYLATCSDCHPDAYDEDVDEEKYELPCTIVLPEDQDPPDHCPRCASYLGMTRDNVPTWVSVTTASLHGQP